MKAVLFYLSLLEDLVSPAAGMYMIKCELPYIYIYMTPARDPKQGFFSIHQFRDQLGGIWDASHEILWLRYLG